MPEIIKLGEECVINLSSGTGDYRVEVHPEDVRIFRKMNKESPWTLEFVVQRTKPIEKGV